MKMKSNLIMVLVLSFLFLSFNSFAGKKYNIAPALKGYELYGWKKNGKTYFTLITGTNRIKKSEEITGDKNELNSNWVRIKVEGMKAVKEVISSLPEKSQVYWHTVQGFEKVDSSDLQKIVDFAKKRKVQINTF